MPLNLKISADILCVINGDLISYPGRIIQLFSGWTRFTNFMQHKSTFCSQLAKLVNQQAASDVISNVFARCVPNNAVKFRDSGLNHCREIRLQVVENGISTFVGDNLRQEVAGDVISGVIVEDFVAPFLRY